MIASGRFNLFFQEFRHCDWQILTLPLCLKQTEWIVCDVLFKNKERVMALEGERKPAAIVRSVTYVWDLCL